MRSTVKVMMCQPSIDRPCIALLSNDSASNVLDHR